MDERDWLAEQFEANRSHLQAVAYRMLGSVAEAEDVVQDAYLRWHGADRDVVEDARGYLARIVTRLCLDHLKSARVRREHYVGPWLPEPVLDEAPFAADDSAHDLSMTLMLALERLSPLERAAFLLHDVFDVDFPEVAQALGRSETVNVGDIRRNVGSMAVQSMPATPATAFLVEYRDGARGTVLLLNGHVQDFTFAGRIKGEARPASCLFCLPAPPGAKYFDCLVANIEKLFDTGRPPYPVERTLLTGGVLEAAMDSHYRRGSRVETPDLDGHYSAPADSGFVRGGIAAPV